VGTVGTGGAGGTSTKRVLSASALERDGLEADLRSEPEEALALALALATDGLGSTDLAECAKKTGGEMESERVEANVNVLSFESEEAAADESGAAARGG
jgi:hypothetical protein